MLGGCRESFQTPHSHCLLSTLRSDPSSPQFSKSLIPSTCAMCAHAADYQPAVAYERNSGLYSHQFHHHLHQPQHDQPQQFHIYQQDFYRPQQQQELTEHPEQYHHLHLQPFDQPFDRLRPQHELPEQHQQQQLLLQQQEAPPSYYQAPLYWEPLPPVAPVLPPLNPIPVPSLDPESRKRSREDIGADEEKSKRLATTQEVLFRLLVSANRVGKLIGKQGTHIKQLRDETGARIRIADAQSPVEDRMVIISSKDEPDQLKCAAEHALIRAATLIIEPETGEKGVLASIGPHHNVGPNLTRLLIAGSQAGCIIGKAGSTIQEIRETSGATVRILPKEQLPPCSSASESDRLMQMSGEIPQVQRALELIATKLRKNPPGESSSTTLPMIQQYDGAGNVVTLPIIPKVTAEMTVPSSLIGGIIGRGGANITQIRQLSGATIKVRGQKDGASHRVIYFEGSSEQVSVAQSLVEALLTQQEN